MPYVDIPREELNATLHPELVDNIHQITGIRLSEEEAARLSRTDLFEIKNTAKEAGARKLREILS